MMFWQNTQAQGWNKEDINTRIIAYASGWYQPDYVDRFHLSSLVVSVSVLLLLVLRNKPKDSSLDGFTVFPFRQVLTSS